MKLLRFGPSGHEKPGLILADGRRIFIRECQVGDMTRGGVVKDYEVAA